MARGVWRGRGKGQNMEHHKLTSGKISTGVVGVYRREEERERERERVRLGV
jgi:hypothetical protein